MGALNDSHGGAGDGRQLGANTTVGKADPRIRADRPSAYDHELHKWVGQCPHGDECSGCDALGCCAREEGPTSEQQRAEDLMGGFLG